MKKLRLVLIISLLLTAALALTACSSGIKKADYDYRVTFDYNLGDDISADAEPQYLGVPAGKLALEPSDKDGAKFAVRIVPNYYLEGWYTAKTDENGEIATDSKGRVILDKKWDFSKDKVESDMTLYANFIKVGVLQFADMATGEVMEEFTIKGNYGSSRMAPTGSFAPKKEGHTLYGYFTTREGDEAFAWPFKFDKEDVTTVYVKFLEGNWSIVRSPNEFNLAVTRNAQIYVDADLDFSKGATWTKYRSFSGTIEGNGHKITGLKVEMIGDRNQHTEFGIFGTLKKTASISNLKIEDAVVSFEIAIDPAEEPYHAVGFFAYAAEEGAKLTNVEVSGTLTYKISSSTFTTEEDINKWIAFDSMREEDAENCKYDGVTVTNE